MTLRCVARFGWKVFLEPPDTIASLARIGSSYKPTRFSVAHDSVAIARDRPTFRRARVYPSSSFAGLRRGHEIYDPLLLSPAQRSPRHCLHDGGHGILRRQRRHWTDSASTLDRG